jgi:hypothetical protein
MYAELKKDDASLQKKSSHRHGESRSHADRNSDLLSGESTEGFTSSPSYALPPPGQGQLVMQCKGLSEGPEPTKISGPLIQRRVNNTGLPDKLKNGIENLSGYSMDDVRVHYNSSKPAQLGAHAYALGTDIHLGPGQDKHLPHEAWHVVQQKQGRVKPTLQMKGNMKVNDDKALEREADVKGTDALAARRGLENEPQQKVNTEKKNPEILQTKREPGKSGVSTSVGHVKKRTIPWKRLSSNVIHWYAWNKEKHKFAKLNETIPKGTEILSAKEVDRNNKMLLIEVEAKDEKGIPIRKSGFVRKKNLKDLRITDRVPPFHVDPYNIIAPRGDWASYKPKKYNESNFEWYLNLAILMDAYHSLEANDKNKETRNDLALAAMQSFVKVASIVSPKTHGKILDFKEKKPAESFEGARHSQYMGFQTAPIYDSSYGYYRSGDARLLADLNTLIADKLGVEKEKIKSVSDPFVLDVMKRFFPLQYAELEGETETNDIAEVKTNIDSLDTFQDSIQRLCANIKKGHSPNVDFVFDVSQYYENERKGKDGEGESMTKPHSKTLISNIENSFRRIIVETIQRESKGDKEDKKLLIENLFRKIQLLVLTKYEKVNILIMLDLNNAGKKHGKSNKLIRFARQSNTINNPSQSLTKNREKISDAMKLSGTKIDPISAKEAMIRIGGIEEILKIKNLIPVTIAKKSGENKENENDSLSDPKNIGEQIKDRLESKNLLNEKSPIEIKSHGSFEDFKGEPVFENFRKLAEQENAPPYVKIYSEATVDLLNGLQLSLEKKGGIDKVFEEKGISNLLQILYTLMTVTMHSAIFVANNMTLFLNQIDKLHNYIQIILAITKPYRQGTVFSDAIKEAVNEPPKNDITEHYWVEEENIKTSSTDRPAEATETKPKQNLVKRGKVVVKKIYNAFQRNGSKKAKPAKALEVPTIKQPTKTRKQKTKPPRPTVPEALHTLVHHQASAMHALSSTLAGVEKQKGHGRLNVLVLKDNYYEAAGKGNLVHKSKAYDISVIDGNQMNEGFFDLDGEKKAVDPQRKFDIFICDFHHNISLTLDEYHAENLIEQVDMLYRENRVANEFTVAIDCTIDYLRSKDIQLFLEANEQRITSGQLNVVLYRSAQKFDMLGLDNYYGGYTITINNKQSYNLFNKRISEQDDHVPGLAHQGLTHLVKHASKHQDNYREAIIKNTQRLYDKLDEAGLTGQDPKQAYISKSDDPIKVFLAFKGNSIDYIIKTFIAWAKHQGKPITNRASFGFPTTNFIDIGGRYRITLGLESTETIDEYAFCLVALMQIFKEDLATGNRIYSDKDFKLVDERIKELKQIGLREIKNIREFAPIPLDILSQYQIGQLSNMLDLDKGQNIFIAPNHRLEIREALSKNNWNVLSKFTINRTNNSYTILPALVNEPEKSVNEPEKPLKLSEISEELRKYLLEELEKDKNYLSFSDSTMIKKIALALSKKDNDILENFQIKEIKGGGHFISSLTEQAHPNHKTIPPEDAEKTSAETSTEDRIAIKKALRDEGESYTPEQKEYADKKNWVTGDYGAGGDCLFFSLLASKKQREANVLRNEIANYQKDNGLIRDNAADLFLNNQLPNTVGQQRTKKTAEDYYNFIRKPGSWGGREEIRAFSLMTSRTVFLIEHYGEILRFDGKNTQKVDDIPDEAFHDGTVVLHKSVAHFIRVTGKKRSK